LDEEAFAVVFVLVVVVVVVEVAVSFDVFESVGFSGFSVTCFDLLS